MKTLPLILAALFSSAASAGTLYQSSTTATTTDTQTQNSSRVVPSGCLPDQPIDSCAPTVKPFDCPSGRHWTNQGGNGLAHCVDDDYTCPTDYSLTHDSLGNPSCYYNPPPPPPAPPPVTSIYSASAQTSNCQEQYNPAAGILCYDTWDGELFCSNGSSSYSDFYGWPPGVDPATGSQEQLSANAGNDAWYTIGWGSQLWRVGSYREYVNGGGRYGSAYYGIILCK